MEMIWEWQFSDVLNWHCIRICVCQLRRQWQASLGSGIMLDDFDRDIDDNDYRTLATCSYTNCYVFDSGLLISLFMFCGTLWFHNVLIHESNAASRDRGSSQSDIWCRIFISAAYSLQRKIKGFQGALPLSPVMALITEMISTIWLTRCSKFTKDTNATVPSGNYFFRQFGVWHCDN